MSCVTESLAGGFANQMKRDSHARYRKAVAVLDTPCNLSRAFGPRWRYAVVWAREALAPVIYEQHTGEKKRAVATFIGVETQLTIPGIAFTVSRLRARSLLKGHHETFSQEDVLGAVFSGHAQRRAIQALGADVKVYGKELVKHAAAADLNPDVNATFSPLGICLWELSSAGYPVCKTFIPSDRLDKWDAPYRRWQSGLQIDGVRSAVSSLDEVVAVGGRLHAG
jgi:hypothetical protein